METLFLMALSILAVESADSIRSLYRYFLSEITKKSLNAFYYTCSYAKADYSRFMNVTAGMALKLIPEKLQSQPVFLYMDDTMISKFGKKFEDVSKLFDHVAHNDSNYLNGHCFVSLMLCISIWNKGRISYLAVPLGYHMWQKKESKLELVASMVRQAMSEFSCKKNVILLCDRWYVKKDLIGNARSDSVIYDFPPQPTEKERSTCITWEKAFYTGRFFTIQRKNRRLLYGSASCLHKCFRKKESPCICNIHEKKLRNETAVFQHSLSGTAEDFLRMAGKIPA